MTHTHTWALYLIDNFPVLKCIDPEAERLITPKQLFAGKFDEMAAAICDKSLEGHKEIEDYINELERERHA